jgi:hypothetical protein
MLHMKLRWINKKGCRILGGNVLKNDIWKNEKKLRG